MLRLFNDLNQKMKTTKHTFKKLATLATIFIFFFTFQTKAQDLSGTYSIHRATDGVMNKNIGTVEIKRLIYIDTGRIYSRSELGENDQLINKGGFYYKISKYIPDNEYEFIEIIDGATIKRRMTINGNGSGTFGNELELTAPLTNPQNRNYTPTNDGWKSWMEYANIDNASYPYLLRRHETESKAVLNSEGKRVQGRDCDVFEMLVKVGSPPYELGWSLSDNAIKSTEFMILNMVWTDNLNVSKFNNGEIILQAKSVAEWQAACKAKKPVWCYYKFNPANDAKFGKIYNYYAVIDNRGLAPKGYHIATESDFDVFQSIMETYDNNGVKEYIFTDEFKEQLGGYFNGQIFDLAEEDMSAGKWWTSTKRVVNSSVFNSSTGTYYTNKEILVYEFTQSQSLIALDTEDGLRTTTVKYQEFKKNWRISESKYSPQAEGYSIRCVKD
jgi:uncharacterized protein (TIGR02145 family)